MFERNKQKVWFPPYIDTKHMASQVNENTSLDFMFLEPAKYTLRVIYDANRNKEWDSGNFLERLQPEEVIYFPKEIDVRGNWDVDQTFDLNQ